MTTTESRLEARVTGVSPPITAPRSRIRIRPFERRELRKMLDIFAQATPRAQLQRTIYLAPGVEAFLARLLELRPFQSLDQLWGVELEGNGFVGAAHTRRLGEYHHLNTYAVLPEFQSRGLGSRMMEYWHGLARAQRAKRLSLHVALENGRAQKHYAAFDFVESGRIQEYRLDGSWDITDTAAVLIQDWPLAQASFKAYGFGRFAIWLDAKRFSVDLRAGEFRASSSDPRLLSALRRIDPSAKILLWSTEKDAKRDPWTYTGSLVCMEKKLEPNAIPEPLTPNEGRRSS